MGHAPRALLAGGLGLAASFLVACGGGGKGLLSSDQASSLQGQLSQLTAALDAGHCGDAANAADALKSTVDNLPSSINPALAANLQQGASTVASLAQSHCSQSTTTSSTTTSSPTTTSSSTTTSTTTSTSTPTSTSTEHQHADEHCNFDDQLG